MHVLSFEQITNTIDLTMTNTASNSRSDQRPPKANNGNFHIQDIVNKAEILLCDATDNHLPSTKEQQSSAASQDTPMPKRSKLTNDQALDNSSRSIIAHSYDGHLKSTQVAGHRIKPRRHRHQRYEDIKDINVPRAKELHFLGLAASLQMLIDGDEES